MKVGILIGAEGGLEEKEVEKAAVEKQKAEQNEIVEGLLFVEISSLLTFISPFIHLIY